MKIILLKDISKIGRQYETKEVSSGHAQNLLIPKGLAVPATPDALKRIDALKAKIDGERKVQEELMVKNIQDLDGISVTVSGKANEKGHLFAGIHKEEIAKAVEKQTRLAVSPQFIMLEQPIKEVGEHKVTVSSDAKKAVFTLKIEATK